MAKKIRCCRKMAQSTNSRYCEFCGVIKTRGHANTKKLTENQRLMSPDSVDAVRVTFDPCSALEAELYSCAQL